MAALKELLERLQTMKEEKAELLAEIDDLKKAGEKKANAMEKELAALKREVKSLRELMENIE